MKKFFALILLFLVASTSLLAGCDLISLNRYKDYNQVVIKIGDIEITKETLIQRYNSVGAQYLQNGYTVKQAMQSTIDSIINRELMIKKAKEVIGDLTQAQVNAIWQEVYDQVNDQLKQYEDQVKKEWDVVYLEAEDEAKKYATYTPYEKKVDYVNGEFVTVVKEETVEQPIGGFVRENFEEGVDWVETGRTYAELQQAAWNRYITGLKNAESWKKLSTIESEMFTRELNRIYEIVEGNKYVELLEENFNNNLDVNGVEFRNLITTKYIDLVQDSFAKYNLDMTAYHKAMGSDSKTVYYHPNSGAEYVYVSHVLIKYSDAQNTLLKEYKTQLDAGDIDQVTYDNLVEAVKTQIAGKARNEEGEEIGENILAADILLEIENALLLGNTVEEKAQIFNNFIYKYGQDDGMFNAETPYVVNLDTEVEDKMVKEFADASRALYAEGEGSLSGLVATTFGYHIIFYSKPVTNIVNYNDLLNITPEVLHDTAYNLMGDKTMYDKMYELATRRSFTNYQTSVINEMKGEVEITLYKSRYSDLIK